MHASLSDRYPLTHHLEDGAKVTCSLMSPGDREALSKFIARLPRHDLLYLQVDITRPEIQERWFEGIAAGKYICICAYDPKQLVGYASVEIDEEDGRRIGEIRINIIQGYRSRGLGRCLIEEVMFIARALDLESMTARMLADQHGARAAFRRLGFNEKRILENYVEDAPGSKDLLVMSVDLSKNAA